VTKGIESIQNNLELIANDLKPFYKLPTDEQGFKTAFKEAYGNLSLLPLTEFQNRIADARKYMT
jgi:hypothetical protein